MLKINYNTKLQPITLDHIDHNASNIIQESRLFSSIFHDLKQSLLNRKIEFIRFLTEEQKNNDKNIICTNFIIDNLLNFLNQKDLNSNIDHPKDHNDIKNIKKKKIEKSKHILLNHFSFFKKISTNEIKKNKKNLKILNLQTSFNQFKKNNNLHIQKNKLNNLNIKKKINSIKLRHHYNHEKINFHNVNQDVANSIKNEKSIIFYPDLKLYENNLLSSKNLNLINNFLCNKNSLKDIDQKKSFQFHTEPLSFCHSENSTEWKRLVSQKILLSISNKDNKAEMHLKPDNLGSIYIQIKMKDDEATLSFISNHNLVRMSLSHYVSFLRNSLKKTGIKLREANISGSLQNKEIKNSKRVYDKNILNSEKFKKKLNTYSKNIETLRYPSIDVYV